MSQDHFGPQHMKGEVTLEGITGSDDAQLKLMMRMGFTTSDLQTCTYSLKIVILYIHYKIDAMLAPNLLWYPERLRSMKHADPHMGIKKPSCTRQST
jgi:hypothetical protein